MTDLSQLDGGIDWEAVKAARDSKTKAAQNKDALTSSAELLSIEGGKFKDTGNNDSFISRVARGGSKFIDAIFDDVQQIRGAKQAFDIGAGTAAVETVAGPVQFALERVSPEAAQGFTDWIKKNVMPDQALAEGHPIAEGVGEVAGTLGTLAVGGEALAPFKAGRAIQAASRAAPIATSSGIGGLLGLTSFQDEPQDIASRGIEAGLGAAAGAIPGAVGGALKRGAKLASVEGTTKRFIDNLKQQVKDLEPHLSPLKEKIDNTFKKLKGEVDSAYSDRDVHGSATVPAHIAREGFDEVFNALKESTVADVTGRVLPEVSEKLGIPRIRAAEARNATAIADHQRALSDYTKELDTAYKAYTEDAAKTGVAPIDFEEFERAAQSPGINLPKSPGAPRLETVPRPELNDVFNALTRINSDIKRTGSPAKSNQLNQIKTSLLEMVDQSNHPNPNEAKRAMAAASDEYIKKIIPYREQFGFKGFEKGATGKRTSADVFETAVNLIEGKKGIHDVPAIRDFTKLVGPGGARDVQNVAIYRGLAKATEEAGTANERVNPDKLADYLQSNKKSLRLLMDPRKYNEMDGFVKLMGTAVNEKKRGHTVMPTFLFAIAGEHAFRGEFTSAAQLAGSGFAVMFGSRAFAKLSENKLTSEIMQRASRYKPGSKEMESLLRRLDAATNLGAAGAGQAAGSGAGDILSQ